MDDLQKTIERIKPLVEQSREFHVGDQGGGCHTDEAEGILEWMEDDTEALFENYRSAANAEMDIYSNIIHQVAMYFDGADGPRDFNEENDVRNDPNLGIIIGYLSRFERDLDDGLIEGSGPENEKASAIVTEAMAIAALHIGRRAKAELGG